MTNRIFTALLTAAVLSGIDGRVDSAEQPAVVCRQTEGAIELLCRGRLVLKYHTQVLEPPNGVDPVYRRSGFIHPVVTPSGRELTCAYPRDHLHQHGVFCAWVKTTFEGHPVDFWNQKARTGNVEHVRIVETSTDNEGAGFTVELRHLDVSASDGPRAVLRELWTIRCVDAGDVFQFDIESRQTCIADSPLIVHEYHYGGMAFRGSEEWYGEETDFEFLTSEGLGRIEGNHTRPKWVVATGTVNGEPAGIAVMGHLDNPRYPEPVRLHPKMPYFVFAPSVVGEFRLDPGSEYVRRYRYLVFDGPPQSAAIDAAWQSYTAAADDVAGR